MCRLHLFFFFQAEHGIRDTSVTGVQTCALPILTKDDPPAYVRARLTHGAVKMSYQPATSNRLIAAWQPTMKYQPQGLPPERSEERRVGKEGRAGGAAEQRQNKREQTVVGVPVHG